MQFVKKFLLLKSVQPLKNQKPFTPLARMEIQKEGAHFFLSYSNFYRQPNTTYHALLIDGSNNHFEFDLSQSDNYFHSPFKFIPNLEKTFSLGVYSVQNFIPLTLAFGSYGKRAIDLEQFNQIVAKKLLGEYSVKSADLDDSDQTFFAYNDEAVATQNYYQLDERINQKLLSIKEKLDEPLPFENEFFNNQNRTQEKEDGSLDFASQDETNANLRQENLECEPYYLQIKSQLDQIFSRYPQEDKLTSLFKDSRWAKINYSKHKYYAVGLVDFESEQKFICYALPSKYSKEPPVQLKGYASFVPKSVFDLQGEGYWLIFQDAISGDCVRFD